MSCRLIIRRVWVRIPHKSVCVCVLIGLYLWGNLKKCAHSNPVISYWEKPVKNHKNPYLVSPPIAHWVKMAGSLSKGCGFEFNSVTERNRSRFTKIHIQLAQFDVQTAKKSTEAWILCSVASDHRPSNAPIWCPTAKMIPETCVSAQSLQTTVNGSKCPKP